MLTTNRKTNSSFKHREVTDIINNDKRPFKDRFTFDERMTEANRVINKHPDKLPIICEKNKNSKLICNEETSVKIKFLVSKDITCAQFIYILRRQFSLPAEKAIFLFVQQIIPTCSETIQDLYAKYKSEDNFLYITYSDENVFG